MFDALSAPLGAKIAGLSPLATRSAAVIAWVEPERSFVELAWRHFGLTVATLGLYVFWARAEARRELHRCIHVSGRPLDYSGTGREGLISFAIALLITFALVGMFLSYVAPAIAASGQGDGSAAFAVSFRWQRLMISLPLVFLLGSVAYRKRKQVLRRTWWAGQRFDLTGQAWSYAWLHFWTAFLVPLTLGWAAPWRADLLDRRKTREMCYGGRQFQVQHSLRPIYRWFAIMWFGGIAIYLTTVTTLGFTIGHEILNARDTLNFAPLLAPGVAVKGMMVVIAGLIPFTLLATSYQAAWLEHQVSGVGYGDAALKLQLPKLAFVRVSLASAVLKVGTLGLFAAVADARLARFVIDHMSVRGEIETPGKVTQG